MIREPWGWWLGAILAIGLLIGLYFVLAPDRPCEGRTGAELDVCLDQRDGVP